LHLGPAMKQFAITTIRRGLLVITALLAPGAGCIAEPLPDEPGGEESSAPTPAQEEGEPVGVAQEPLTCELLSAVPFGDSVCVVYCVLRGHRGGHCDEKDVCVCRG
jgi:hypothetical protein